jgi:hypothetical protein
MHKITASGFGALNSFAINKNTAVPIKSIAIMEIVTQILKENSVVKIWLKVY